MTDGRAISLNEYCTWIADTRYEERFTDLSDEEQKEDLFTGKTFVVQMNDGSNFTGVLNFHQLTDSAEEMKKLPLLEDSKGKRLDPKRLSRANTVFSYQSNLPMLVEYLETEFATDKTLLFPKDCHLFASAMPLAKSKWPTHAQ